MTARRISGWREALTLSKVTRARFYRLARDYCLSSINAYQQKADLVILFTARQYQYRWIRRQTRNTEVPADYADGR